MPLKLINKTNIKKYCKEINPDKRIGDSYLYVLEGHIKKMLVKSLAVHNGSKKTLDQNVASYVGLDK
jgi:hypothetical protein